MTFSVVSKQYASETDRQTDRYDATPNNALYMRRVVNIFLKA